MENALRTGTSRPVGALVSFDRFGSLPYGARRGIWKIPALQLLLTASAHLLVAFCQVPLRGSISFLRAARVGPHGAKTRPNGNFYRTDHFCFRYWLHVVDLFFRSRDARVPRSSLLESFAIPSRVRCDAGEPPSSRLRHAETQCHRNRFGPHLGIDLSQ